MLLNATLVMERMFAMEFFLLSFFGSSYLCLMNSVDMIIIASLSVCVSECVEGATGRGKEGIIHIMLEIPKRNHLRKIFLGNKTERKNCTNDR